MSKNYQNINVRQSGTFFSGFGYAAGCIFGSAFAIVAFMVFGCGGCAALFNKVESVREQAAENYKNKSTSNVTQNKISNHSDQKDKVENQEKNKFTEDLALSPLPTIPSKPDKIELKIFEFKNGSAFKSRGSDMIGAIGLKEMQMYTNGTTNERKSLTDKKYCFKVNLSKGTIIESSEDKKFVKIRAGDGLRSGQAFWIDAINCVPD